MDERRLRAFLAVVENGTVTEAARRLHVAQPSLSQTLQALEADLGAQLFDRAGRGLRLSTAGEALVGPARQVLRAMDEARAALSEVVELRSGTITLAALATLAVAPLADLIGAFRRRHPGIQVRVVEPETLDGVVSLVRTGICELGVGHLTAVERGLILHPLGEQELLLVFPPSPPTRGRTPVRIKTLANTPLVVSPAGTSTRTLLEQALAEAGVTAQIAVETATREAIIPLILNGAGAALLPAPLAEEAGRRGAQIRRAQPAITRPVALIHRAGSLTAAAQAFLTVAAPGSPNPENMTLPTPVRSQ